MICSKCGAELPEGMAFCGSCGASLNNEAEASGAGGEPVYSAEPQQRREAPYRDPRIIESTPYLIFAILATLFCFLPTGIPAIIYAAKIDSFVGKGNFAAAQDAARKSRLWSIVSAVVAVVSIVVIIAFYILFVIGIVGVVAAAGAGAIFS